MLKTLRSFYIHMCVHRFVQVLNSVEKKSQLLFSGSHKIVYTFYIMAHVEIVATNIKV